MVGKNKIGLVSTLLVVFLFSIPLGLGVMSANLDVATLNSTYVPYNGSINNTDLGAFSLYVSNLTATNGNINTLTTGGQLTVDGGNGASNIHIVADADNVNENDVATLTLSQDGGLITGKLGFDSSNNLVLDNTGVAGDWGTGLARNGALKFRAMSDYLDAHNNPLKNVADPIDLQDAVTLNHLETGYVPYAGAIQNVDMEGNEIIDVSRFELVDTTGTESLYTDWIHGSNLAEIGYTNLGIFRIGTESDNRLTIRTNSTERMRVAADGRITFYGVLDMDMNRIADVADPALTYDALNLNYFDNNTYFEKTGSLITTKEASDLELYYDATGGTVYSDSGGGGSDPVTIIPDVLVIERNAGGGYWHNTISQSNNGFGNVPLGDTKWNTEYVAAAQGGTWGWSDLSDVKERAYESDFAMVTGYGLGNKIVGAEAIMHVISTNQYFKVNVTSWGMGGSGLFALTWEEINFSGGNLEVKNDASVGGNLGIGGSLSVSTTIDAPAGVDAGDSEIDSLVLNPDLIYNLPIKAYSPSHGEIISMESQSSLGTFTADMHAYYRNPLTTIPNDRAWGDVYYSNDLGGFKRRYVTTYAWIYDNTDGASKGGYSINPNKNGVNQFSFLFNENGLTINGASSALNWPGASESLWINGDNEKIIIGQGKDTEFYWDNTDAIIDTTTGNLLIKNNSGWGTIEYGNAIEHTYITNKTNQEAYDLVKFAEANGGNDGNHSAWGECYSVRNVTDRSRPEIVIKEKEVCFEVEVPVCNQYNKMGECKERAEETEIIESCEMQEYESIEYFYEVESHGTNVGCKNVMLQKANTYLSSFINPQELDDGTKIIDGEVALFEEVLTKTKLAEPDRDYCGEIMSADVYNKANHYAYKELVLKDGSIIYTLDSELRDVYTEGCEQQKLTEMCIMESGAYSWCDEICTSGKDKNYNWCKK